MDIELLNLMVLCLFRRISATCSSLQIEKNFLRVSFRCQVTLLQEAVILMVGENKYLKGKFISFETKYLKSVENDIY